MSVSVCAVSGAQRGSQAGLPDVALVADGVLVVVVGLERPLGVVGTAAEKLPLLNLYDLHRGFLICFLHNRYLLFVV